MTHWCIWYVFVNLLLLRILECIYSNNIIGGDLTSLWRCWRLGHGQLPWRQVVWCIHPSSRYYDQIDAIWQLACNTLPSLHGWQGIHYEHYGLWLAIVHRWKDQDRIPSMLNSIPRLFPPSTDYRLITSTLHVADGSTHILLKYIHILHSFPLRSLITVRIYGYFHCNLSIKLPYVTEPLDSSFLFLLLPHILVWRFTKTCACRVCVCI